MFQGVPAIYWDVVYGRFQETARDVERMAGRQMSPSRSLTCKLQVICTYARHYLLDKLPGGKYDRFEDEGGGIDKVKVNCQLRVD